MQLVKSHGVKLAAFVGAALVPVLSFAQAVGDPFTTAVADATTKVTGYAGALVGFSAVAVLFMVAMKYVKKIPRAA